MIKQPAHLPPPDGAIITQIDGDDALYFFKDDREVSDAQMLCEQQRVIDRRNDAKQLRHTKINCMSVSTHIGDFDACEISQQRMHRAIEILNDGEVINWTLADNTVASVTRAELREALRLAFLKQSALHINQSET